MDEQTLLNAPETDYMNAAQLAFFEERLRQLRAETLSEIETLRSQISNRGQVSDVTDRATQEEEAAIAMRIADRKQQLIYKIDAARQRIRSGEYGYCVQSGEPIGIARLLSRPTAETSTDIKTLSEKREQTYERH